jgi:hypothetical protein
MLRSRILFLSYFRLLAGVIVLITKRDVTITITDHISMGTELTNPRLATDKDKCLGVIAIVDY